HGKDSATAHLGYGPHWEGALVTIPWQMYLYSGDKSILKENYEAMKKYLAHLENVSTNYLLNFGIDDHKSIITHTEGAYISSAYFHWLTKIMADVAAVLEKPEDKIRFTELGKKIFGSFNDRYYDSSKSVYGNGGQTQMALALGCGLVTEENHDKVLTQLIKKIEENDYHFDCGVVGLKKIIDVLLENNRKDVLYKLATRTDFPSIGHWIEQGANTMWQNWDGSQSRNHIMFGSIGDYFYQGLAGIEPVQETPGFEKIKISPQFPDDLSSMKCGHKCKYGWIKTSYSINENEYTYQLEIPEKSIATLTLPFNQNSIRIEENKEILKTSQPNTTTYELKGGRFTFKIEKQPPF
ncbi:MAG: alpha-L-rhamnosidase C-terminal domain-containing protein, partial [Draconibacterium sp.]|nr:alpha-L-rhamnosidase C-terminal domain-containing protein [Draconibacterium sp.]